MTNRVPGFLPDETPKPAELFFFALQQIVVMFPATVLVALITGFHVSTTIFASGLATLAFLLFTKRQIPLYYGSSFSYITAIASIMGGAAYQHLSLNQRISMAQFGIMMSGLVSIAAGFIIKKYGAKLIEKVLPATVTGPWHHHRLVLCANAMSNASPPEASLATAMTGTVIALITDFHHPLLSLLKGRYPAAHPLVWPLVMAERS